jgi:kumamolisin
VLDASGARVSETAWNDDPRRSATGGGTSGFFPGRTVPDVAGNADPVTGYLVTVDGEQAVIGGTSAVAPLYAAMSAIVRQLHGKPFDLNQLVGADPTICFDVTQGDNGGYRAGPGRDNVSGWGVVDFGRLLATLGEGSGPTPDPVPAPNPSGDAIALLQSIQRQIAAFLADHSAA